MHRAQTPVVLWDFCCQYMIELRNRLARPLQQLNGRTPYELIIGNTPDISEFLEFCWYQPIWYYESNTFPQENRLLGHWIGLPTELGRQCATGSYLQVVSQSQEQPFRIYLRRSSNQRCSDRSYKLLMSVSV